MSILKQFLYLFLGFSILSFSQTQEATLHFSDGTSSEGYASIFRDTKIKFRLSLDAKPHVWSGEIVKGVTFDGFEFDILSLNI